MKGSLCVVLMTTALFAGGGAHADLVWRAPATVASHHHGAHDHQPAGARGAGGRGAGNQSGHGDHRRPETLRLLEPDAAKLSMWRSDLTRAELSMEGDELALSPTGFDSYHALIAERDSSELHESAMRYPYMRGKPSGRSPSELLAIDKVPLEIVPDPIAREHHRYLSDRTATFHIRYRGQPLPHAPLSLETSNGTFVQLQADAEGRIAVRLPEDFATVGVGRRNNKPADFIVRARHTDNGKQYRASLSAPYHVNPHHWESNRAGLAAAASGFVVGLGILGIAGRRGAARVNGGKA